MSPSDGSCDRIEHTPGVCGGRARVGGHRIAVWLLEEDRRQGWSVARILEAYPSLEAEDVRQAWRYAELHPAEIDSDINDNEPETLTMRSAGFVKIPPKQKATALLWAVRNTAGCLDCTIHDWSDVAQAMCDIAGGSYGWTPEDEKLLLAFMRVSGKMPINGDPTGGMPHDDMLKSLAVQGLAQHTGSAYRAEVTAMLLICSPQLREVVRHVLKKMV